MDWYQGQGIEEAIGRNGGFCARGFPQHYSGPKWQSAPVSEGKGIFPLWECSGNSTLDTNVLFSWWVCSHSFISRRYPRKPEQKGRMWAHLLLCTRQIDKLVCLKHPLGTLRCFQNGVLREQWKSFRSTKRVNIEIWMFEVHVHSPRLMRPGQMQKYTFHYSVHISPQRRLIFYWTPNAIFQCPP